MVQGHRVTGCEWVESACTQFFAENNIQYSKSPLENVEGNLFQVGNIEGNLFQMWKK